MPVWLARVRPLSFLMLHRVCDFTLLGHGQSQAWQTRVTLTLSSCPRDLHQPICCTKCLLHFVRDDGDAVMMKGLTVLLAGLDGLFLFDVASFDLFSGWL